MNKVYNKGIGILICTIMLFSCKSGKNDITPVKTDTTAIIKITPQTDPVVAKSAGYFLDDWMSKTFTAPSYANIA